jgi:xanthine dehydrogenase accessory factor
MRTELLQLAADLARRGEPFVLAVVVRREPASSAHTFDMAITTAEGGYHGWLGGNCTRPTVRREARRALADGQPRLVSLTPEPATVARPGVTELPMTCHSGGTVDIYLEPMVPAPRLLLFGPSPSVRALAQLGRAMGWRVDVVDPIGESAPTVEADRVLGGLEAPELRAASTCGTPLFAVVATMGEYDEDALATALALKPAYLGVVASRTRFAEIRQTLLGRGVPPETLDRVHSPAGLDLRARLPEEVAVSILAEIVAERRAVPAAPAAEAGPGPVVEREAEAVDPICGMTVATATARHRAEHAGRTWYFCNARCREKFLAEPERHAAAPAASRAR